MFLDDHAVLDPKAIDSIPFSMHAIDRRGGLPKYVD
jgi:hypothetical protein